MHLVHPVRQTDTVMEVADAPALRAGDFLLFWRPSTGEPTPAAELVELHQDLTRVLSGLELARIRDDQVQAIRAGLNRLQHFALPDCWPFEVIQVLLRGAGLPVKPSNARLTVLRGSHGTTAGAYPMDHEFQAFRPLVEAAE